MKPWKQLIVWLTLVSTTAAHDETVIVVQQDGTVLLSEPGQPTVSLGKARIILPPGQDSPDPPQPPPKDPDEPDPPSTGDDLADKVTKLANDIPDPAGARIMGVAYKTLAEQIEAGNIPADAESVDKAITETFKHVFDMLPSHQSEWREFYKQLIDEDMAPKLIAQKFKTKADWSQWFRSVQAGLDASHAGAASPDWLVRLLPVIVEIILEFLRNMFGAVEQLDENGNRVLREPR